MEILLWVLKIALAFYFFKGLLGKFVDGDFSKALGIGALLLSLLFVKSFVIGK